VAEAVEEKRGEDEEGREEGKGRETPM